MINRRKNVLIVMKTDRTVLIVIRTVNVQAATQNTTYRKDSVSHATSKQETVLSVPRVDALNAQKVTIKLATFTANIVAVSFADLHPVTKNQE